MLVINLIFLFGKTLFERKFIRVLNLISDKRDMSTKRLRFMPRTLCHSNFISLRSIWPIRFWLFPLSRKCMKKKKWVLFDFFFKYIFKSAYNVIHQKYVYICEYVQNGLYIVRKNVQFQWHSYETEIQTKISR